MNALLCSRNPGVPQCASYREFASGDVRIARAADAAHSELWAVCWPAPHFCIRLEVPPDDQNDTDDNHGKPNHQFDGPHTEPERRQEDDHESQKGQQTEQKVPDAGSVPHAVKRKPSAWPLTEHPQPPFRTLAQLRPSAACRRRPRYRTCRCADGSADQAAPLVVDNEGMSARVEFWVLVVLLVAGCVLLIGEVSDGDWVPTGVWALAVSLVGVALVRHCRCPRTPTCRDERVDGEPA